MRLPLCLAAFLLTCLLFPFFLWAQVPVFSIKGQVHNASGLPVHRATVALLTPSDEVVAQTISDKSGHFLISYARRGSYILSVRDAAHESFRSDVFELTDKNMGIINLVALVKTLDTVVVQSKQKLVELDGNTIVYHVSKSINAQGTNALEVLKRAPGVFVEEDQSISLNGKHGVLLLLDGKQTYLSMKELADLLKSMPSSQIRSIEIISNPSSKYDAAGTAGIINIKTIKSNLEGFSGNLNSGLSYGVSVKQTQDFSFNYRKERFNVYGGYNHFIGHYSYLYGSDRIQQQRFYNSFTDDTDKRAKMGSRIGTDYQLNTCNTIGMLLTGNFIFGGGITRTATEIGDAASQKKEQQLDAVNDYYHQQTNRYNLNVHYTYEDSLGHSLSIDADYGHYAKSAGNLQSNRYSDAAGQLLHDNLYRTINGATIHLRAIKADYTTLLWKGKLELGCKYSSINAGNDSRFSHVQPQGDSLDERRSNAFRFKEKIGSGYLNYKKTSGQWTVQAGLRMEYTRSNGHLLYLLNGSMLNEITERSYTNFFPAAGISVQPHANYSLGLSYSRRIDRPDYQDLNPFVYMLDELSFWQGNPFLQPQFSHRASIQYAYKNNTVVSFNVTYTDQYRVQITDSVEATKIVMIPRNVGRQRHLALVVTRNFNPTRWWSLNCNGTIFHIQNTVSLDAYRNFALEQLAGRLNLQQTFRLPGRFTAELTGLWNTKRLSGANNLNRATSQVDIGLQKPILKDKGVLRLSLIDLYKGSKASSEQLSNGFYIRSYSYYETRQVRLNFSYKFASTTIKAPRSRNSALENENGRVR